MPQANSASISWRTSSYSYPEQCLEFACFDGDAFVRDSKNKHIGSIGISGGEWMRLVSAARHMQVHHKESPGLRY